MVALLSHLIQSFRCLVSAFAPNYPLFAGLTSNVAVVHHFDLPLPPVLHKTLSKSFIDNFDEVIVIGDIHGCYDEMIQLLVQINDISKDTDQINDSNNNDRNRILKLFVGDIVNKGPKSKEVLQFLMNNSDSCLSVRGNHDEVVISEYLKYESGGETALKDKNRWMKDLTRKQIDYLISMPYTISIPSLNALVVHAGIVPNIELNKQKIRDMIDMRNLVSNQQSSDGNQNIKLTAISSHKEGDPWVSYWLGPQHIYFGHDARRKLQINTFSTGLDTGCVYGNSLTSIFIYGPRTGNFVSVEANAVHSPPKVETNSENSSQLPIN